MRLSLIVRGQHPTGGDFDQEFTDLLVDRFLVRSVAEVADRLITLKRGFEVSHLIASVHWRPLDTLARHAQQSGARTDADSCRRSHAHRPPRLIVE